ncbi:MAG TPA: hypothetical protein VNS32_26350, partial [Flavisolibacter sp.]|nr:hypothetical protein [Flavisolibacter sp.]
MFKPFNLILLLVLSFAAQAQGLRLADLRTEDKSDPTGIDISVPRLSWKIYTSQKNILQTAYRILVADDPALLNKNLGNIWDSKKTLSDASIQVAYSGKKLEAVKTYYWKVMIWDNKNHNSGWSQTASWQMGLLTNEDWEGARWIAYDKIPDSLINTLPTDGKKDKHQGNNILPLFRKEFSIEKPVKKATMFICGLGQFELSLNGNKV